MMQLKVNDHLLDASVPPQLYQLIPTFPFGRSVWNNICIMELGNIPTINIQ